jgi:tRNA (guanosine-2'-O-)-methyltransferase
LRSEKRSKKIDFVVRSRQHSLQVVLENIHDPHNVSAIFRTCDAAGIPDVSLIYNYEKFPRIGKKSSASAYKWVEKNKYKTVEECYANLRKHGFQIIASSISEDSKELYELDFTKKSAIVLGNEHRGVSDEAANLADQKFQIPMFGMVQSLNVSVAAAITVYEALRQRKKSGMYPAKDISEKELQQIIDDWLKK